jgi:hypothetical protein
MDRLIIAYNNVEGAVTRSDFVGMRIADESEAEGIEAEFKAQFPDAVQNKAPLAGVGSRAAADPYGRETASRKFHFHNPFLLAMLSKLC